MIFLFHWQTIFINSLTFLLVGIAIFYAYTHTKSQSFGNIFISENAGKLFCTFFITDECIYYPSCYICRYSDTLLVFFFYY